MKGARDAWTPKLLLLDCFGTSSLNVWNNSGSSGAWLTLKRENKRGNASVRGRLPHRTVFGFFGRKQLLAEISPALQEKCTQQRLALHAPGVPGPQAVCAVQHSATAPPTERAIESPCFS
eukprot:TRINITY_DN36234_c0_g1_i2.p1 TRINITY_DN36234_c0_g1~~TRINITY_DN36234_c0_g1_i2.p1  ORF type:complete len:120 (+),score=6.34 TRINITY_DN36234_c0_g1_i2:98-457(+)